MIEIGQALAAGTLLVAFGGLMVGIANLQTNRLSKVVAALETLDAGKSARIVSLESEVAALTSRVKTLEDQKFELVKENHRLMAEVVELMRIKMG